MKKIKTLEAFKKLDTINYKNILAGFAPAPNCPSVQNSGFDRSGCKPQQK